MIIFFLTGIQFSCQKELYFDQEPGPAATKNQWEFIESSKFSGEIDSAILQIIESDESVSVYGTSSDNNGKFFLQLSSARKLKTGTYKNADVFFSYSELGIATYRNEPGNNDDFSVNISLIDSLFVSGTFEGKTKDASGNAKIISNGKFTAQITGKRVQSAGAGNGQLVLWSRQGCGSNTIKVKVENKESNITSLYNAEPACTATGVASFTLPAGSYSCLAICGSDTVRIGVTVSEGICSKVEVGFCSTPQSGCRISADTTIFSPTSTLESKIYTFNSKKQVVRIERINLRNSEILQDLRISYSGSQIVINQDGLFNLDGCGRVREYVGYDIPGNYQNGKKLFMRYYYNAEGYMERATYADAVTPEIIMHELKLTWAAGNLTKAIWKDLNSIATIEYEYQYDQAKQAKNFAYFIPNNPIIVLQSAFNFGTNSYNLISKIAVRTTTHLGQQFFDESYYTGYTFDADNNVRDFVVSGNSDFFFSLGNHFLGYTCF